MTSYEGGDTDAAILEQIRELAGRIGDERTRKIVQNVTDVMQLNPQPLPPAALRAVLEAVALNPQPLPPSPDGARRAAPRRPPGPEHDVGHPDEVSQRLTDEQCLRGERPADQWRVRGGFARSRHPLRRRRALGVRPFPAARGCCCRP
jgi:hypothetical protein